MSDGHLLRVSKLLSVDLLLVTLFNSTGITMYTFPTVNFYVSVVCSVMFSLTLGAMTRGRNSFTNVLYSKVIKNTKNPLFIDLLSSAASLHVKVLLVLIFVKCVAFVNF